MVWKISLSIQQTGIEPEIRVEYSTELLIGRAEPADIQLDDAKISRRHCWLRVDTHGTATVEDAGSAAGTYFNGSQLRGVQPFTETDELRVGTFTLKLTEPPSHDG
ncbi:MAG: FHA domain-containing protein [Deltaproteobacteria bacterium]|nr:FHA domain-containing protein [Deltaproteobacteria bacterium]